MPGEGFIIYILLSLIFITRKAKLLLFDYSLELF